MNNRIRELALQATKTLDVEHEGYMGRAYTSQEEFFDKEKFAELIVLDPLNMIACEANQYAEPTWAYELLNDIKDRYGVEK